MLGKTFPVEIVTRSVMRFSHCVTSSCLATRNLSERIEASSYGYVEGSIGAVGTLIFPSIREFRVSVKQNWFSQICARAGHSLLMKS